MEQKLSELLMAGIKKQEQDEAIRLGIPTQSEVKRLLNTGKTHICFEKSNGSLRNAVCTTDVTLLPESEQQRQRERQASKKPTPDNPAKAYKPNNTITFWDLDKNGWRSFNYDKLKEINVL